MYVCVLLLFRQVDSTNVGSVIGVRFNLVSKYAYSGDWGWILGGVPPSLTVDDANYLSPATTNELYEERLVRTKGRALTTRPDLCWVSAYLPGATKARQILRRAGILYTQMLRDFVVEAT